MEEGGKMCCWQEMFVFVSAQLQYDDNKTGKCWASRFRWLSIYDHNTKVTKTGKKHFCRWDNEDHAHGTWLHFKSSSIWGGFDVEIMVWTISTRSVVCYPSHLLFFISMQKREGLKLQRIRIPASSRSIVNKKKHQTQRKMIFCLALNKHWSEQIEKFLKLKNALSRRQILY